MVETIPFILIVVWVIMIIGLAWGNYRNNK